MKKEFIALAALAVLFAPAAAHATDKPHIKSEATYEAKDNGGFLAKDKVQSTDEAGTTTSHESSKKVTVDNEGNKETKVEVKTSTDPKGLFNKTSTKVENEAVQQDGETKIKHKKTVDGKTVEETEESHQPK